MPRTKQANAGATKPEDMDQEVWDLGTRLGNVAIAKRLIDVADGAATPDASELPTLIEASASLESKALKKHMRLREAIGQRIADSLAEYQTFRKRTGALTSMLNGSGNGSGQ